MDHTPYKQISTQAVRSQLKCNRSFLLSLEPSFFAFDAFVDHSCSIQTAMQPVFSLVVCSTIAAGAVIHNFKIVDGRPSSQWQTPASSQEILGDLLIPGPAFSRPKVIDTTCPGQAQYQGSTFWLDQIDHTDSARGYAPFIGEYSRQHTRVLIIDLSQITITRIQFTATLSPTEQRTTAPGINQMPFRKL